MEFNVQVNIVLGLNIRIYLSKQLLTSTNALYVLPDITIREELPKHRPHYSGV